MGHVGTLDAKRGTGHPGSLTGPGHPIPLTVSYAKNPITHLQLAAMNLIADHEAGVAVDAHKLEFARRLLAGKAKA